MLTGSRPRGGKAEDENMLPPLPLRLQGHPYEAIGKRTTLDGGSSGRESRQANSSRRRWGSVRAAVLCGAALCSVGLWVAMRMDGGPRDRLGGTPPQQLSALGGRSGWSSGGRTAEGLGSSEVMQVLVSNKYQREGSSLELLYPWEHQAEPMRETRLEIFSWPGREQGDAAGKLEFM